MIRRNRISTTEVADALGKTGRLWRAQPIQVGYHKVGPVFWARANRGSNWWLHHDIQFAPEGSIVAVDAQDCDDDAIFGELVAKYLVLYRQVAAVVTNGPLRDAPRLIKERWPIWCEGFSPIGVSNSEVGEPEHMRLGLDGSVAVCDDSGVVLIPSESVDAPFVDRLREIENQEDDWFAKLDQRQMSTFDIVCLGKS